MNSPQLVMIADDLTGAADAGIAFSRAGLTAIVALGGHESSANPSPATGITTDIAADVTVINTHSRHLPTTQARQANWAAAQQVLRWEQAPLIYQKIDSTLRGDPATALWATAEALTPRHILVAPAFPAQKRTTEAGQQMVDGEPLHATVFGAEVPNGNLLDIFSPHSTKGFNTQGLKEGLTVKHLPLQFVRAEACALQKAFCTGEPTVFIADAVRDADLRRIAQAALENSVSLFCGSAGLAHALAAELQLQPQAPEPPLPPVHHGPILICAGSRHPQTRKQLDVAHQLGAVLTAPPESWMRSQNAGDEAALFGTIGEQIDAGSDILLATAGLPGLSDLGLTGQEIAQRLGTLARSILADNGIGGLVLTGGDTAMAVCRAIGASHLLLQHEIEPGIASGRIVDGPYAGMPLVTKAGGFGSTEAIANAIEHLHSASLRSKHVV